MKKIIFSVLILAVSLFGFTGCWDAIYQNIRDEIELTTQKMPGFINNIARYDSESGKKYLFLANGALQVKDASREAHGAWKELSGNGLPDTVHYVFENTEFSGFFFSKVISDKDCVYALGFKPSYDTDNSRNVPVDLKVYFTKPSEENGELKMQWKEITGLSTEINKYQDEINKNDDDNYGMGLSCHLFGTNSVNPDHRAAFLRIGGGSPYLGNNRNEKATLYKLNGDSIDLVAEVSSESAGADSGEYWYSEFDLDTLSVVYFDGKYHFMNYLNAETNEGTADSSGAARTEPTYVYFGDYGHNLYYFSVDDFDSRPEDFKKMFKYPRASYRLTEAKKQEVASPSDFLSKNGEVSGYIENLSDSNLISIAVTSDSVLVGTGSNRSYNSNASSGSGIVKALVDENGKPTKKGDFTSNADKIMLSPYIVRALLAVDPSKKEAETSIYSAMDYIYTATSAGTNSTNRGLWAYYPAKGEWNRE